MPVDNHQPEAEARAGHKSIITEAFSTGVRRPSPFSGGRRRFRLGTAICWRRQNLKRGSKAALEEATEGTRTAVTKSSTSLLIDTGRV
jgi:hypothetical protein